MIIYSPGIIMIGSFGRKVPIKIAKGPVNWIKFHQNGQRPEKGNIKNWIQTRCLAFYSPAGSKRTRPCSHGFEKVSAVAKTTKKSPIKNSHLCPPHRIPCLIVG